MLRLVPKTAFQSYRLTVTPGLELSYVASDHFGASYRACRYLHEMGHQRIGFGGHMISHASSVADRFPWL
jgi:DNA-binding LacI/PurR family transcriptional regulator